jgi:outer membrane protein assembly factor BamA
VQTGNIEDGFPMNYNYIKFHEILNLKMANNNYLGIGYHLDHYFDIEDLTLQLKQIPYELTPHYLYSAFYGFKTDRYTLSGLSLSYVFDSRDHLINAYNGYFINVNYRFNPKFLGSSQQSSSLMMEFRSFLPLSKKIKRHLIAFWMLGNFRVSGRQPYLTLMALGEDQRSRSGRGYIAGRYR